jgi:hypothetical protein
MHAILHATILLVADATLASALSKVVGMVSGPEDVEPPAESTESPSRGRKPRAVTKLTACRCGVLFPAAKGKKGDKRFCSPQCYGQSVVEARNLRDRGSSVEPAPDPTPRTRLRLAWVGRN